MNKRKHVHKATRSYDVCFSGPVSHKQNPAAWGGICVIEVCQCGCERRTNVNQEYAEKGVWEASEES